MLTLRRVTVICFHSIGFPCERGAQEKAFTAAALSVVSIQLGSPARGERGWLG